MCYIIIHLKRLHYVNDAYNIGEGVVKMGTIVCQTCNSTIEHFEDEKVSVLYTHNHNCQSCDTAASEK
jgi:hypothetical protein